MSHQPSGYADPAATDPDPCGTPGIRSARAGGRDFHLLWFGEGISLLGSTTCTVLLPLIAVLTLHAGPAWTGALIAATWLPWLVIGLPAGAWIDTWPPRVVMIVADLVSAAALATIPLAAAFDVLSLPQLVAVALVTGAAGVFFRTAYALLVPALVPDAQLDCANGRLFGTEAVAQVVGPGLAGRLSAMMGAATATSAGVVGFLVSALCLLLIRRRPVASVASVGEGAGGPATPSAPVEPLGRRLREGIAFVAGDPYLRWFTVIGALSNLGMAGYGAVMVVYLADLGLEESGIGSYFMVGALGGVLGSLVATRVAARLGTGRAATLFLLAAPAALLIGLPTGRDGLWLSIVGYVAVGVTVVAGNIVRGTWRQRYVPRPLLGRVLAVSLTVNCGTMPLAGVLAGWSGTVFGARPTVLALAGVHVVASWLVLASPVRRLRELPVRDLEGDRKASSR